jgi:hypothetical protein
MSLQEARTSSSAASIWRETAEVDFRQHLVELEEITNAVPMDSQRFLPSRAPVSVCCDDTDIRPTLPIEVEQQLADDFAFLAAIEEGAQSVAAACIEEHTAPPRLIIRFAAMDVSLNADMKLALEQISSLLSEVSRNRDHERITQRLFEVIVSLHSQRLQARLRSEKWDKPKHLAQSHKKPLWQDFANVRHRVQFLYAKKEARTKGLIEQMLSHLERVYTAFESSTTEQEGRALLGLVNATYQFCTTGAVQHFARRLNACCESGTPTKQVAAALKCLRQIEKIGAYWRVTCFLTELAKQYPHFFEPRITMEYLTPYRGLPTTIGYESWATTCHVHAEIQLAVYYDLKTQHTTVAGMNASDLAHSPSNVVFHHPRCIGTSKRLCYLCYHFLEAHGKYRPSATHGRLYDQWTIPDLSTFSPETCQRYRDIVATIDAEVLERKHEVKRDAKKHVTPGHGGQGRQNRVLHWKAEPMTSRQNLLEYDLSLNEAENGLGNFSISTADDGGAS